MQQAPYIVIKHFLSDSSCDMLRSYGAENMEELADNKDINPYFNGITIHVESVRDTQIKNLLLSNVTRTRRLVETFYNAKHQYLDHTTINMWPTGRKMGPHADNMFWDTGEKNYVPHRTYSAILYLNADYTGGEFSWYNIKDKQAILTETLTPEKGMLVAFGAGIEYVHAVQRVKDGTRWTQPIWFAEDVGAVAPIYRTETYTQL